MPSDPVAAPVPPDAPVVSDTTKVTTTTATPVGTAGGARVVQEVVQQSSPGIRTSEFSLTLISLVVGLAMMAWGAYKGNDGMVIIGGAISGVTTGGYSVGRGLAKRPA